MNRFLAAVAALLLSSNAYAHDYVVGALTVTHPQIYETPPRAMAAGGFFLIQNDGAEDDRLIAVRSDLSEVQIHETRVNADGVSQMIEQTEGVAIPAGETVIFEPGGLHVMFIRPPNRLEAGDTVAATLVFEKAGELQIEFGVEERSGGTGMSHDGAMQHGTGHGMGHGTGN